MHLPNLSTEQRQQLELYARELQRLNRKLNLVSRETDEQVWDRHIRHCLTIATRSFPAGAALVDWGTGGGLPAIPLAVMYPEIYVTGVDAVRKKTQACAMMARRIGLQNANFWHGRAEKYPGAAHYSVSRATAPLSTLWSWHTRMNPAGDVTGYRSDVHWKPGLICLKGGDLSEEIEELHAAHEGLTVVITEIDVVDMLEEKLLVEVFKG